MVWESVIVCITIYLLFGDYIKAKTRELELKNERQDEENDRGLDAS